MKAIILAAGLGTRLLPLTEEIPKALIPILNRPIIEIQVENLRRAGFDEIGMNLHYMPDMIKERLKDGSSMGVSTEYRHEEVILETGGGLANFSEFIASQEDFILHNCDILTDLDLRNPLEFHREKSFLATFLLVDNPPRNTVLIDSRNRVLDIGGKMGIEPSKGDRLLHGAGIFIYNREIFRHLPGPEKPHGLIPSILRLLKESPGAVGGYVLPENIYWRDIGSIASYFEAHRDLLSKRMGTFDGFEIPESGMLIGDGCQIDRSSRMEGFISAGDGVIIPPGCRFKDCVFWSDSHPGEETILQNAVITPQRVQTL